MKKFFYSFTFAFLMAILFTGVSFAQDTTPPTDDEVNAIASQLYCPVCESTPLDVCPTEACKDWREQIRVMLSEGKSEEEILKYFEAQYGEVGGDSSPAKDDYVARLEEELKKQK